MHEIPQKIRALGQFDMNRVPKFDSRASTEKAHFSSDLSKKRYKKMQNKLENPESCLFTVEPYGKPVLEKVLKFGIQMIAQTHFHKSPTDTPNSGESCKMSEASHLNCLNGVFKRLRLESEEVR